MTSSMSEPWTDPAHSEHLIGTALTARYLLENGKHYVLDDDQVHGVDPLTGRALDNGRASHGSDAWPDGLVELG